MKKSPLVQGLREVGREIDSSVIQRLIAPLKGLGGKLDDLVNTPDSVKAIEDMLKNAPNALDDAFDTPDWMKNIEDWFKGLEFPDLDINMPNLQIPQQQMSPANLMGDFAMSDLDAGIESVTPSELFAQKDYLAGLLD